MNMNPIIIHTQYLTIFYYYTIITVGSRGLAHHVFFPINFGYTVSFNLITTRVITTQISNIQQTITIEKKTYIGKYIFQ